MADANVNMKVKMILGDLDEAFRGRARKVAESAASNHPQFSGTASDVDYQQKLSHWEGEVAGEVKASMEMASDAGATAAKLSAEQRVRDAEGRVDGIVRELRLAQNVALKLDPARAAPREGYVLTDQGETVRVLAVREPCEISLPPGFVAYIAGPAPDSLPLYTTFRFPVAFVDGQSSRHQVPDARHSSTQTQDVARRMQLMVMFKPLDVTVFGGGLSGEGYKQAARDKEAAQISEAFAKEYGPAHRQAFACGGVVPAPGEAAAPNVAKSEPALFRCRVRTIDGAPLEYACAIERSDGAHWSGDDQWVSPDRADLAWRMSRETAISRARHLERQPGFVYHAKQDGEPDVEAIDVQVLYRGSVINRHRTYADVKGRWPVVLSDELGIMIDVSPANTQPAAPNPEQKADGSSIQIASDADAGLHYLTWWVDGRPVYYSTKDGWLSAEKRSEATPFFDHGVAKALRSHLLAAVGAPR